VVELPDSPEMRKNVIQTIKDHEGKWDELKQKLLSLPQPTAVEEEIIAEEIAEEEAGETTAVQPIELPSKELEIEFETTAEQPPAVTTAVVTAPAPEVKPSLVKIYLLSMRLPSKYLLQEMKYEERREIREFDELAGKLETIRRSAYTQINRIFAHVESYGTWIAVTEDAVREAQKVSEFVKNELKKIGNGKLNNYISRYDVKVIPVYLEVEDAKEILEAAIAHISDDIRVLEERIMKAENENKKAIARMLEKEAEYRTALLNVFKQYLANLS